MAPTNYTAQFTPEQLNTFQQMLGYSNGTNTGNLNTSGNTNVTNGSAATGAALSSLGSYNPTNTNNPAALVADANQYVAGQNIPAEVAQAEQQGMEQARDVTLPGIEQNAAATGNANSSREGIAQGLVERGLAENAQNLTGSLSSQAFSNGLQLAENQASNNNTNELGALSSEGTIGNTASLVGTNTVNSGVNDQGTIFGIGENAGQGEQAANQAQLTNEQQQYQAAVNDPYAALAPYMDLVGRQMYGSNSTGNSTTTSTPSAWSVIGGLLGAGGSIASGAGSLGWKPFGA